MSKKIGDVILDLKGMRIRFMAESQDYDAEQLGIFTLAASTRR